MLVSEPPSASILGVVVAALWVVLGCVSVVRASPGGDVVAWNPGPGDPCPELVYGIHAGGTFRLSDYRGKKAVLIANHLVDDGPVSWLPRPFERLKWFQNRYRDTLAVFVLPEFAHHRDQNKGLWRACSKMVAEVLDPGEVKVLVESRGGPRNAGYGHGRLSMYSALNPQDIQGWWPMVLVGEDGRIAWTSQKPHTNMAEHMIYETDLRQALIKLLEPEEYARAVAAAPRDWVKQDSPWGRLEVEDFERYRDLFQWHISRAWTARSPVTWKGELAGFPTRSGYRSLSLGSWMSTGNAFGYPFYYGYRDPDMGGLYARHAFSGRPRSGTLAFHFAGFLRASMFDYHPRLNMTFRLEGPDGFDRGLAFMKDGRIAGNLPPRPGATWNPNGRWQRISFHVDPKSGTRVFLDKRQIATARDLKALTAIRFVSGYHVFADDFVFVPRLVTPDELDEVVRWVDEHAAQRPHVTPLEREREIASAAAGQSRSGYPKVLRANWGSTEDYRDPDGHVWKAEQPFVRGTWGYLDGSTYEYPADTALAGTRTAPLHRTLRYALSRLRFTVPNGVYTFRVHTCRPFRGPTATLGGGLPAGAWERRVQMEFAPDAAAGPVVWRIETPYRQPAVFEKKGIRVTRGLLDVRFNYHHIPHLAASELIQESVDNPDEAGIFDSPSMPARASPD